MASSVNAKGSIPNIPTKNLKGMEVAGIYRKNQRSIIE